MKSPAKRKEYKLLKRNGLGRQWFTKVNGKPRFATEEEYLKAVKVFLDNR